MLQCSVLTESAYLLPSLELRPHDVPEEVRTSGRQSARLLIHIHCVLEIEWVAYFINECEALRFGNEHLSIHSTQFQIGMDIAVAEIEKVEYRMKRWHSIAVCEYNAWRDVANMPAVEPSRIKLRTSSEVRSRNSRGISSRPSTT